MIGYVGTLLGRDKVNIANMSLSRQEAGPDRPHGDQPGQRAERRARGASSRPTRRSGSPSSSNCNGKRRPTWVGFYSAARDRGGLRLPARVAAVRLPGGPLTRRGHLRRRAAGAPVRPTCAGCSGTGAGNVVLALDVLKGVARRGPGRSSSPWGRPLHPQAPEWSTPAALGYVGLAFALVGHSFSCFTRFRGGKGVATAAGGLARPHARGRRDRGGRVGGASSTRRATSPWPRSWRPSACRSSRVLLRRGPLAVWVDGPDRPLRRRPAPREHRRAS